jgi:hypothetical protein
VTDVVYQDTKEFLVLILKEEGSNDTLFQQYEEPLHFHTEAMDFLNRKFPQKWKSNGGDITLQPCSRDLTVPRFFSVFIKNAMHVLPLATILSKLGGMASDTVGSYPRLA